MIIDEWKRDPVYSNLWINIILVFVAGPVGGYFFGVLMWHATEARYLAARSAAQTEREHKAAIDSLAREVRDLRETLERRAGEPSR